MEYYANQLIESQYFFIDSVIAECTRFCAITAVYGRDAYLGRTSMVLAAATVTTGSFSIVFAFYYPRHSSHSF
jgi:hypothetical protein